MYMWYASIMALIYSLEEITGVHIVVSGKCVYTNAYLCVPTLEEKIIRYKVTTNKLLSN